MKHEIVFLKKFLGGFTKMKKSKILGIALAAAMVSSVAAISVSAIEKDEMKDHTVGITGSFCNWGNTGETDVPMSDDDGDGVYEGTFTIDSVEAGMISAQTTDKGPAGVVETGKVGVQFKIRLDGTWGTSWGDFEEAFGRTENSQTNCCVEVSEGQSVTITVKLDTNKALEPDPDFPDEDYKSWEVTYTSEIGGGAAQTSEESKEEESKEEESKEEESKEEKSKEEESKEPKEEKTDDTSTTGPASEADKDATPVATGDTTSAVALVAVVIASLGAAVVMTKKASSKE